MSKVMQQTVTTLTNPSTSFSTHQRLVVRRCCLPACWETETTDSSNMEERAHSTMPKREAEAERRTDPHCNSSIFVSAYLLIALSYMCGKTIKLITCKAMSSCKMLVKNKMNFTKFWSFNNCDCDMWSAMMYFEFHNYFTWLWAV